jgi:hypothetical protein
MRPNRKPPAVTQETGSRIFADETDPRGFPGGEVRILNEIRELVLKDPCYKRLKVLLRAQIFMLFTLWSLCLCVSIPRKHVRGVVSLD